MLEPKSSRAIKIPHFRKRNSLILDRTFDVLQLNTVVSRFAVHFGLLEEVKMHGKSICTVNRETVYIVDSTRVIKQNQNLGEWKCAR